jgi:hypothetical protein
VRDGVRQHDVESRYAVSRDYQQLIFDSVNIPYLAAPKKFNAWDAGLNDRIDSLASSSRIYLSNRSGTERLMTKGLVMAIRIISMSKFNVKRSAPEDQLLV